MQVNVAEIYIAPGARLDQGVYKDVEAENGHNLGGFNLTLLQSSLYKLNMF